MWASVYSSVCSMKGVKTVQRERDVCIYVPEFDGYRVVKEPPRVKETEKQREVRVGDKKKKDEEGKGKTVESDRA